MPFPVSLQRAAPENQITSAGLRLNIASCRLLLRLSKKVALSTIPFLIIACINPFKKHV